MSLDAWEKLTFYLINPGEILIALTSAQQEMKIVNFETWQEEPTLPGGWLVQFALDMYLMNLDDIVALAKSCLTR